MFISMFAIVHSTPQLTYVFSKLKIATLEQGKYVQS